MAVIGENASLSYGELDQKANQIATALVSMEVVPGTFVGVYLDRCPELICTLIGILRAGAAFVPLDPTQPTQRINYIVNDAKISLILTNQAFVNRILNPTANLVCLEDLYPKISSVDNSKLARAADHDLAYAIYTSGSTGKPKGVIVERRSLSNYVEEAIHTFEITSHDRVLQFASLSFDTALEEIFPILICGGSLILRNDNMLESTQSFFSKCCEWRITLLDLPTSYWHRIVGELTENNIDLGLIRGVIIGGEKALPISVVSWNKYTHAQGCQIKLWNTYGLTETTIVATRCEIGEFFDQETPVPIGTPIRNAYVRVLDSDLNAVPQGDIGELCIGGTVLARGYLNCPELTNQLFVADPYSGSPGQRLFRTGDLVRQRADGQLEYIGRQDDQIKIAGFRVELTEIESTLAEHPDVAQVATRFEKSDDNNYGRLLAFAVAQHAKVPTEQQLCDFLQKRLPHYMLPQRIILISEIPLTSSGKVDRLALSEPELRPRTLNDYKELTTQTERSLAKIWRDVLELPLHLPRLEDDFFALGGNSLLAIKTIALIEDQIGTQLTLLDFLDFPQLAQLASWIDQAEVAVRSRSIAASNSIDSNQPLSFQQQALWVFERLESQTSVHTVAQGFQLMGKLKISALESSLNVLVERHPVLRTHYSMLDDTPVQNIYKSLKITIDYIDLRRPSRTAHNWNETAQRVEVSNRLQQAANQPMNFPEGPLFRVHLLQSADQEHYLLLLAHHSIIDGWSLGLLLRELGVIYTNILNNTQLILPPLPLNYIDFALWQRNQIEAGAWRDELAYWRKQLGGRRSALQLASDFPRTKRRETKGSVELLRLPSSLVESVQRLSVHNGTSKFIIMLAAFKAILLRYTSETDIVVGTLTSGRERSQLQNLIGYVANTLLLRLSVNLEDSFSLHLKKVNEVWRQALAHQDIPFDYLQQALVTTLLDDADLVDIYFVHYQIDDRQLKLPGLDVSRHEVYPNANHGDLLIWVDESDEGIQLIAEYDSSLFLPLTIRRLLSHYQTFLEDACSYPYKSLGSVALLTTSEHQERIDWNSTTTPYRQVHNLTDLLTVNALRSPDRIAVIAPDTTLSYRNLEDRANCLAVKLIHQGVEPGDVVALKLDRGSNLIVGIIAVLKVGAAYMPLDNNIPQERTALMLTDSGTRLIVTDKASTSTLPAQRPDTLLLDTQVDWWQATTNTPTLPVRTPGDIAYLIYTSGSTGKPKGVMIPDRAAVNLLISMAKIPGIRFEDRLLAITPITFDIAFLELLLPLTVGATTVIATHETAADPQALALACEKHDVTLLQATPVTWRLLLETGWCDKNLTAWCGGEAMPADLAELLCKSTSSIWNMYGPTETTVWSSCHNLTDPNDYACIGRPIDNTRIAILDSNLQSQPVGVVGELFIAGHGLAAGYHNRPKLNDAGFINAPLVSEQVERSFRTGDLARYRVDGSIEYVGRRDNQVKLRGFRVELGEIETTLNRRPDIQEAVTAVFKSVGRDDRIVAYIVPAGDELDHNALRKALAVTLPRYMIPQHFIELPNLPITANGKIDRQALPEPEIDKIRKIRQPHSAIGKYLALKWAHVLGIDVNQISLDDNFFDLGGHSLLAIQIVTTLRRELILDFPLRLAYEAENLADLVTKLEEFYRIDHDQAPRESFVVPLRPAPSGIPLFCICGIDLYRQLANRLQHNGPVYAVFVHGETDSIIANPNQKIENFLSVKELASEYVDTIIDYLPNSQYHLAGVSFGGILAMEIAQQLKQRGLDVGMLAMLDTVHPQLGFKRRSIIWIFQDLWNAIANMIKCRWGAFTFKPQYFAVPRFLNFNNSLRNGSKEHREHDEIIDLRSAVYLAAQEAYETLPYAGKALLVKASQTTGGWVYRLMSDYGWKAYIEGELIVETVEGDHLGILKAPAVDELANILDQQMASCDIPIDPPTNNTHTSFNRGEGK